MAVRPVADRGPIDFIVDTAAERDDINAIYLVAGTTARALDTGAIYYHNGTSWAAASDTTHIADTSDAHDASAISVADAGSYTTNTDVESALQELYSYKPLFSTLTSDSADIQNDTLTDSGLVLTLPVVGTYVIEALLLYTTAAAADIDFKFVAGTATITGTVGTSDISAINAPGGDATAARVPTLIGTSWTTAQELATTGAPADASPAFYKGKIVATVAGTVKIQFAQGTTDASNTHVGAGSYFMAQRVA